MDVLFPTRKLNTGRPPLRDSVAVIFERDCVVAKLLLLPLMRWAGKLRYPTLFKVTAVALAVSVLWPLDPIPLLDEIVLGLGTLLLANWKRRGGPAPIKTDVAQRR